jgi:anti-sigma B factor antagonist
MREARKLHEATVPGQGLDPAGGFTIDGGPLDGGVHCIRLEGELDMAATAVLRERVAAAAGTPGVVVDLAEVRFADSSVLKELLRANAELGKDGTRVVLAAVPAQMRRLLELTRTDELFEIAADRDDALRLLARG